jgi:enterochelin esterase-like enzyme
MSNPEIIGTKAVFRWLGQRAPFLIGDFTAWEHGKPVHFLEEEPGKWAATVEFLDDTYMEYAFWDGENRVVDPLNSNTTPDGFGHFNHYFYMGGRGPTPFIKRSRFPRGTVSQHALPTHDMLAGRTRDVWLYKPPVDEPCPLYLVWDGRDYLQRVNLPAILDNMIGQGRIQPIALAMVQNGGSSRMIEYYCSDITLAFIRQVVLPLAHEKLNLLDPATHPGAWGVMGASMGGLMALYTGLRLPQVFGHVLSQSGGFRFENWKPIVHALVENGPTLPIKIWMDAGRYEWLLEPNRQMHALLQERGYDVTYHEFSAGHNYPAWRDDLPAGLECLLKK